MEFLLNDVVKPLDQLQENRASLVRLKQNISEYHTTSTKNNPWNRALVLLHPWTYVYAKGPKRVSRAFYKLAEMLERFEIPPQKTALCLCEAPGGFVECLRHFYPDIAWRALSLPGGITFSKKLPQSSVSYGDILKDPVITKPVGLVTADGGMDCSEDYAEQETLNYPIIKAQIDVARRSLTPGGTFIIKVFDIYTYETFQVLIWLCSLFETVNVCKPPTSRSTNSEKYLVCRNFKGVDLALADVPWEQQGIPEIFNNMIGHTTLLQIESINKVISQIKFPQEIDFSRQQLSHFLEYRRSYSY